MMLRAYFLLKQLSLNAFSAKILIVSSTGMFVKKAHMTYCMTLKCPDQRSSSHGDHQQTRCH